MTDTDTLEQVVDTTNCEREAIHIPGAILPHGAMLVMDPATLEVLQVAGDTQTLIGLSQDEILGRSAHEIFRGDQVDILIALTTSVNLAKPRHLLDPLLRVTPGQPLDASLHLSGGWLVLEVEAADITDRFAADPLAGVQEMVEGLDAAVSLQTLCQMAAERVRTVARYDRVLVYRFMHDDSGWVIAESRQDNLEPFLNLHYPAADIPAQARALYVKNWLRLITQVNYDAAPLHPPRNPRTGEPLDMSQAILRDVSAIHREYLRNMGIDASMSISIIRHGKLWGLIACHNYSPRILPRHLRAICELFGSMFSLQLEARETGEQFQERLASRMVLQNLMLNLASAEDYAYGLTQQSPNLLDYIHGGDSSVDGARNGGVAVAIKGQLTFLGVTPNQGQIEAMVEWLNARVTPDDSVFSTDRLGEVWPEARAFADVASGILAISVSHEPSDYIIWFRPELVGTTQWAGEPKKLVTGAPGAERLSPRKSFEIWKETVRGRCLPWATADIDAAFDLRVSLLHVVLRRINTAARERKRAADRDKLLLAELDHRVKNTIANIQALVVQTSRSADTLTGFVEGLDGRIQSMAKAHSLLSQSRWEGVSIDKILHEELNPYSNGHFAVSLSGTDVLLTPKSALSLSLAIHELATNAAKHGALRQPSGRVSVHWRRTEDGGIALSWHEAGGPPVTAPTKFGFGTTLIERALAMETGGTADIQYLAAGVTCEIYLPLSSISQSESDAATPSAETPAAVVAAPQDASETFRILVVEDSFLIVVSLEGMLDDLGWTIIGPAAQKAEAMAMARSENFDAALLDVNLNGEMTWDVASVLKERDIPFVFSTGYDITNVLPAFLAGSQVVSKPFGDGDLERELRLAIAKSRAARAAEA